MKIHYLPLLTIPSVSSVKNSRPDVWARRLTRGARVKPNKIVCRVAMVAELIASMGPRLIGRGNPLLVAG